MNIVVTKENKEQALQSVYKSIIGFIPGNHILNELLDYRANVQQNRLNKFSEFLKNGFEDITGKSFDPENLKSEHFLDVFESIVKKVASTSSEEKLKRYRNVLLRAMFQKDESEIFFKYLDLIDSISDSQIMILSGLYSHETFTDQTIQYYLGNPSLYNATDGMYIPESDKLGFLTSDGKKVFYSELQFFLIDLNSKGLINIAKNPASKGMVINKYEAEKYIIKEIGKEFIEFIKEYGK